jgi:hypothetical protein
MQARSVSTSHQVLSRAIKQAAFFADPGGYSFSPTILYEELDGYAKIAYDAEPSKHSKVTEALLQMSADLLWQFSVQGADKVFEVYAESTAHISQFQDV